MSFSTFPVGDFLTRLKNSAMAKNKDLKVQANNQIRAIADVLKRTGYLAEVKKDGGGLAITLSYKHKRPVLTDLKLVSKPGLRVYKDVSQIEKKRGPSIFIISTPKGILSSREAIKQRTGGEVIAEIW